MNTNFTKKCLDVALQMFPKVAAGDWDSTAQMTSYLWDWLDDKIGFRLYPLMSDVGDDVGSDSIEYAQIAYDKGYDVILADGKCLGYRKMPS